MTPLVENSSSQNDRWANVPRDRNCFGALFRCQANQIPVPTTRDHGPGVARVSGHPDKRYGPGVWAANRQRTPAFGQTCRGTEIVSGLRFDARPTIFRFLPLGTMAQVWSEFGVVRIHGTAQGYEPEFSEAETRAESRGFWPISPEIGVVQT